MSVDEHILDQAISGAIAYICENPLVYVSEMDIHTEILKYILKNNVFTKMYPTGYSIGRNQKGVKSKTCYKTPVLHREYGHSGLPKARSDIVIFDPEAIKEIDDPFNLKANGEWLRPDYIIEIGTEKSGDVTKHMKNDVRKLARSKKRGYLIHVYRNLCRSNGERKRCNEVKFEKILIAIEKYARRQENIKTLVVRIDIGNESICLNRPGKVKLIMDNFKFCAVNKNEIKNKILDVFRKKLI